MTVLTALLALLLWPPAVSASEAVWLDVNQTHTLSWDWESEGSPVTGFVFRCGTLEKTIPDTRTLHFGALVDTNGRYEGCTLAAKNDVGESRPVPLPPFVYTYSYNALLKFSLELAALLGATTLLVRQALVPIRRWALRQTAPAALPEPLTVLTTPEAVHVSHHA
jgi:hypothetical protein